MRKKLKLRKISAHGEFGERNFEKTVKFYCPKLEGFLLRSGRSALSRERPQKLKSQILKSPRIFHSQIAYPKNSNCQNSNHPEYFILKSLTKKTQILKSLNHPKYFVCLKNSKTQIA